MDHLPEGGVLGMDGRVVNTGIGRSFEKLLKVKKGTASIEHDLAGELWTERPELPAPQVWVLEEKYAGLSAAEKIAQVRACLRENAPAPWWSPGWTAWPGSSTCGPLTWRTIPPLWPMPS